MRSPSNFILQCLMVSVELFCDYSSGPSRMLYRPLYRWYTNKRQANSHMYARDFNQSFRILANKWNLQKSRCLGRTETIFQGNLGHLFRRPECEENSFYKTKNKAFFKAIAVHCLFNTFPYASSDRGLDCPHNCYILSIYKLTLHNKNKLHIKIMNKWLKLWIPLNFCFYFFYGLVYNAQLPFLYFPQFCIKSLNKKMSNIPFSHSIL